MSDLLKAVRSSSNIHSSWLTVKANIIARGGKKTKAEIDDISRNLPSYLSKLHKILRSGSFVFGQQTGIRKKRKGKSDRPLVVYTVMDRIVQRAILNVFQSTNTKIKSKLGEIPSILSIPTSIGGIPRKSRSDAILLIQKAITNGATYYIKSDIKNFFTKVPKDLISYFINQETKDDVFTSFVMKALSVELKNKDEVKEYIHLFPTENIGVAQGSSLSVFAGNIVLRGLDHRLNDKNIIMIRYIDDFIVLGTSRSSVMKAFVSIKNILSTLKMEAYDINEDKSKASAGFISDGFDFLGCTIRTNSVTPSRAAKLKFIKSIKSVMFESLRFISEFGSDEKPRRSQDCLTQTLTHIDNKIRGWGDAYVFCKDRLPFHQLDSEINDMMTIYISRYKQLTRGKNTDITRRMLGISLLKDALVD